MTRLDSAVVTVGSFTAGSKHNIIPGDARLKITVRSYTPEVRLRILDAIARIAKGEALAAGVPEPLLPEVITADEHTPAAFNTHELTERMGKVFAERFGKERVVTGRPQMGGEDFSEYWLADKSKQALLFWIGGVPADKWAAAAGDVTKLPSLHSAHWAPDAETTISTAVEAMTSAALAVLAKQ